MFRAGRFRFMRECSLKRSADFVPGACARTRSIPRSETGGAEAPPLQKHREKEKEAALKDRLVKQEGRSPPHRAPRPRHKSTKKAGARCIVSCPYLRRKKDAEGYVKPIRALRGPA